MQQTVQTKKKTSSKPSRLNYWKYWKLFTQKGRQIWEFDPPLDIKSKSMDEFLEKMSEHFSFNKKSNPNSADLPYRYFAENSAKHIKNHKSFDYSSLDYPSSLSYDASKAAFNCLQYLKTLQNADGHWPGDYGGPMFLLPALIFTSYITNSPFPSEKSILMKRYMLNHQNDDGGWGLHIEGESTMFGTVMQYCALRILGVRKKEPFMYEARKWIKANGGATGIPSWGKFFLSVLGVFEWQGCNSLLPEMWLLPRWTPMHPGRYWCHARMVYLPMSYCYGFKIKADPNPLLEELKEEIYVEDYKKINWVKVRNEVAEPDIYKQPTEGLKLFSSVINLYEWLPNSYVRKKALSFILDYVNAEDHQTNYIDIGPVNQIINSICIWHAYGKESYPFKQHVDRWNDYLWLAEDGMKMQGYNGSQLWDAAFCVQGTLETKHCDTSSELLSKAYSYIDESQIKEEVKDRKKFFRHKSVGGWPFSTLAHGWPISDCTAEGLKTTLKLHRNGVFGPANSFISSERLTKSTDLLLSWQNKDGGWATYENQRGGSWLEVINPSEIFGEIMVDYSWVECTSACVTALVEFQKDYPTYRKSEIQSAIINGVNFIKDRQNNDGSWIGSWGVCFTYGTWFGVEALVAAKEYMDTTNALKKACQFLISRQNPDGGWGESHRSCIESRYVPHENSQVINTSWAALALMAADCPNRENIDKAIRYILSQQTDKGEWPQQGISGVFNKTCMITYSSYRNTFPLWALGRYSNAYSRKLRYKSQSSEPENIA